MNFHISPAVSAALTQASDLWPRRSRAADGTVGDLAHMRRGWPATDHAPQPPQGFVDAFDITHDTYRGVNCNALAALAIRDKRTDMVIWNRRIWTYARRHQGWRFYFGLNGHTKHMHVTVKDQWRHDTSPWWTVRQPKPSPLGRDSIIKELQAAVGMSGSDVDGRWGAQTSQRLSAVRAYSLRLRKQISPWPGHGPVMAVQRALGLPADGRWGKATNAAVEHHRKVHQAPPLFDVPREYRL